MYLQHFNLVREPFSLSPNPKFLSKLNNSAALFNSLIEFLNSDQRVCIVKGSTGIGKSTLCRKLLKAANLHKRYFTIGTGYPKISKSEFYQLLREQLELAEAPKTKKRVRNALKSLHTSNRHPAIIVDNAEVLPEKTLQALLELTDREHKGKKLLKSVLFINTEVESAVETWSRAQIDTQQCRILEMSALERSHTSSYVKQRLRLAGRDESELFSPSAIDLIAKVSGGRPRLINILAHKAMISAYQQDLNVIDDEIIDQAIRDTECIPSQPQATFVKNIGLALSRRFAHGR